MALYSRNVVEFDAVSGPDAITKMRARASYPNTIKRP
jgi:hypothetical protein